MTLKTKFGHELMGKFWPKVYPIYNRKMAKISPKIIKIEMWPKPHSKVIYSQNKSHRDHIWGMIEL